MESQDIESDRRRRRVLLVLFVLVIIFIIWWLLQQIGFVPNTVGLSPQRSRYLISQAGFETSMAVVPTVVGQEGRVILQSPKSGWRFKWWPVTTIVSRSMRRAAIGPDAVSAPYRTHWPPIKQGPAAGEVMPSDPEEMGVRPASGYNAQAVVPNVQAMTASQARARMSSAGLTVRVYWGPSTTRVAKGHVYYQKPAPGTVRSANLQVVKIWLADGSFAKGGGPYKQMPYPGPQLPDRRPLP